MVVEIRTYRTKPGRRSDLVEFFLNRSVPALRAHGMQVVGPFLDLEDPDSFVWLRIFPSLEERERMKSAFYDGEPWKGELEEIAMPMLESYASVLCEPAPGCAFDRLAQGT